ncbi:MAG: hypothetical protein KKD56_11550 [Acidobacteria bacterium]|nr:hypothetical protein [Acidobacteriota bacterium]MBU4255582.1 hypothetical protein [Acidobacteriota bacterium]MBU4330001.1 hypothetical protein [Acidobacteriota bacterium]MBU4495130.1 hypothetical protein [Acidobacteriota bacterium]MCG2816517.1 hypothetical protein [Candidatus Aminicenantes bacterium]
MMLSNCNSISVDIPEKPLLHRIGKLREEQKISKRLKKELQKAVWEIRNHAQPKAVFHVVPVYRNNGSIVLNNKVFIHSKKLALILNPCRKVAVFLTTIGAEVDRIIKQHMKNRPHFGFLLDAAASVAAESVAQYVQDYIEDNLQEDEKTTLRFSPGYCDWPLEEQKKIFNIVPHESIGVNLSESYLMSPRKSISGVIGICPSACLEASRNACLICAKPNCLHRRPLKDKIDL